MITSPLFNKPNPTGTLYYRDGNTESICIDSIEEIGGLTNIMFHSNDSDYFYEEYIPEKLTASPNAYIEFHMKAERWLKKPRKEPTDWDEVFNIDHVDFHS